MTRRNRYIHLPKKQRRLVSILIGTYLVLLLNSALLLLFDGSTALVYMSTVLLHIVVGLLLVVPVVVFLGLHLARMPLRRNLRATAVGAATAGSLLLLLGTGVGLVALGSSYGGGWMLGVHIAAALTTVAAFFLHVSLKRGIRYHFLEWDERRRAGFAAALQHPLGVTLAVGVAASVLFVLVPWLGARQGIIVAADGQEQPSSQSVLAHQGFLDDATLAGSETCGQNGCHPDIYQQWSESMHRFSSFNNPYYKASIEAMIERKGAGPTRWCASCHDPLVLFTGRFADGVPLDFEHPTSQAGLTCLSCHAIEGLRDVRGNGRYVIAAPDEYPFARATEGVQQWVHNVLVRAKPEPHREAMLKPVHRTAEFCGTCHKVGIPPDVNDYRWKRGQNEYDAWHASGASGNTVRSFYLPKEPQTCTSCHMPLVPSNDRGHDGGLVRSHRFAAANTALPHLNGHADQLAASREVLQSGIISVDVFGVEVDGTFYGPDEPMPVLRPGQDVAVTAVVRNLKVGHAFPGGTNDSNELWLELQARATDGRVVLASGRLDAEGRVDSTAHFFGSELVDRASRPIDKRNAQDWIATVYANTIGPGTARTVHYRFRVPAGARIDALSLALQHRKFKWRFNEWTFRGHVAPGQPDSLARHDVDLRTWVLGEGEAPDLPVTTMATARRQAGTAAETSVAGRPLWERWNDYGIGLFLEGDTRGALAAFRRVSALAPENPEGPVNEARVLIDEGQLDRAVQALEEAERRRPGYLKTAYFRGAVHRASGLYDRALDEWMRVYAAYPNDRVLVLGIGRIHYLEGRYEEALTWFDRVLAIDPEDVGALYNRMLTLGALGRDDAFAAARERYEYHKDDEDAQAVASRFRRRHPMPNRESQPIHTHELHPVRRVPLDTRPATAAVYSNSKKVNGDE